jgi:hypothetical protein
VVGEPVNVTCWHQPADVSPEREPHSSSHTRLTPRAYPQHSSTGAPDDVRGRLGRSRARFWPRWESPLSSGDRLADRPARGGDDHARALRRRDRARGLPCRGRRPSLSGAPRGDHDRRADAVVAVFLGGSLRRRNVQLWQQNTNTGRLTEAMLDGVFLRARELLQKNPQTR